MSERRESKREKEREREREKGARERERGGGGGAMGTSIFALLCRSEKEQMMTQTDASWYIPRMLCTQV